MRRKRYYRTSEFCKKAGISRATFFRWLKEHVIEEVQYKDRRGWRLFTEEDVKRVKRESNKIQIVPMRERLRVMK